MNPDALKYIYFIGIGGIGMSAIARYFNERGVNIAGYDKTKTVLTEKLEDEGMKIHYEDNVDYLDRKAELVIYTPAVPSDHKELTWYRDQGYTVIKRSEALGVISAEKRTIAIAGTHGKTTTCSMVSHILKEGGLDVSAFLGGILTGYETNFLSGKSDTVVLEADEYDRSFLALQPDIAAIMSMDADHLDIYDAHDKMLDGFRAFTEKIKSGGLLFVNHAFIYKIDKSWKQSLNGRQIRCLSFGIDTDADVKASNVRVENGRYYFDCQIHDTYLSGLTLNMPGRHNIENALVAIAIALFESREIVDVVRGLSEFKGIKRRFEKVVETDDIVFIDDYAHHPTELRSAIGAAKELYEGRKITGIFQPHLYSRTRDFQNGFAESLDELDEILLMDIYPARELPIEGITSEVIFEKMKNKHKTLVTKKNLVDVLKTKEIEILMTLGAGDIDVFVPQIRDWINNV